MWGVLLAAGELAAQPGAQVARGSIDVEQTVARLVLIRQLARGQRARYLGVRLNPCVSVVQYAAHAVRFAPPPLPVCRVGDPAPALVDVIRHFKPFARAADQVVHSLEVRLLARRQLAAHLLRRRRRRRACAYRLHGVVHFVEAVGRATNAAEHRARAPNERAIGRERGLPGRGHEVVHCGWLGARIRRRQIGHFHEVLCSARLVAQKLVVCLLPHAHLRTR